MLMTTDAISVDRSLFLVPFVNSGRIIHRADW